MEGSTKVKSCENIKADVVKLNKEEREAAIEEMYKIKEEGGNNIT